MRVNAKYDTTLSNILGFLEMKKELKRKTPLVSIAGLRLVEGRIINEVKSWELFNFRTSYLWKSPYITGKND